MDRQSFQLLGEPLADEAESGNRAAVEKILHELKPSERIAAACEMVRANYQRRRV